MNITGMQQRSLNSGSWIAFCAVMAGLCGQQCTRAGDFPKVRLQTFEGQGVFHSFAFSPDGKIAAGASGSTATDTDSGNLVLWDMRTGKIKKTLPHEKSLRWLTYSGDGATLATYGYTWGSDQERANGLITIWAIRAGKARTSLSIKDEIASTRGRGLHRGTCQLSPDGKRLVAAVGHFAPLSGRNWVMSTSDLVAWDTKTGKEAWRLNDVSVRLVALSPDGKTVAAYASNLVDRKSVEEGTKPASYDTHRLILIDAAAGKTLKTHDLGQDAIDMKLLEFAVGGHKLACLDEGGFRLRDTVTGKTEAEISWDQSRRETDSFAVSQDGQNLLREGNWLLPEGVAGRLSVDGKARGRYVERIEIATGKVTGLQTFATDNDAYFGATFISPDLKHLLGRTRALPESPTLYDVSNLEVPAAP